MQEFETLTMDNFHKTRVEVVVPTVPQWVWFVAGLTIIIGFFAAFRYNKKKKENRELSEKLLRTVDESEQIKGDKADLLYVQQQLISELSKHDVRFLQFVMQ